MESSLILWPANLPLFVLGLLWEDLGSSPFPPQCLAPILSEDLKQINYLQTTLSSLSAPQMFSIVPYYMTNSLPRHVTPISSLWECLLQHGSSQ